MDWIFPSLTPPGCRAPFETITAGRMAHTQPEAGEQLRQAEVAGAVPLRAGGQLARHEAE